MNRPEPQPSPSPCREIQDAIARPPGRLDPDFHANHLNECSDCAQAVQAAQQLALAWNASRPTPPSHGFDRVWAQVAARAESGEGVKIKARPKPVLPMTRVVVLVLAQAAAVLIGWTFLRDRGPIGNDPAVVPAPTRSADHAGPAGMLAMLGGVPAVIDVEPSEVTILRVGEQGAIDRRDIDSLEISDTETVGFDTTVLGYFEALGGS